MRFLVPARRLLFAVSLLSILTLPSARAQAVGSTVASSPKTETIEWVFRVRYGYHDEWFRIFQKYQVAILERQKQLGYVKDYSIWSPGLHTSEESRWDYRIVVIRTSHDAPHGQSESDVAKQLFPDQQTFRRDELRRWELTTNHWDLPIYQVNPNSTE
jgi:hypothetical protein